MVHVLKSYILYNMWSEKMLDAKLLGHNLSKPTDLQLRPPSV